MNAFATCRKGIGIQFIILSIGLLPAAHAQVEEVESKSLVQVIDWLEIYLKYDYFKTAENNWWNNSFEYYEADTLIIYKNVYNPNKKGTSKIYYVRNIPLVSLNPHNIDIRRTYNNKGRYTDGIEMVFHTTHHEKVITKSVNTRPGTNESSFRIILPQFLLDSTYALPEMIKAHFQRAIHLVHTSNFSDFEGLDRVKMIIGSLEGNFTWETHNPDYYEKPESGIREYSKFIDDFRLEITESHPDHPERDNRILIGYDTLKQSFYHIEFTRKEITPQIDYYQVVYGDSLHLVSEKGDERRIMKIISRNEHRIYWEKRGDDDTWVPKEDVPVVVFRRN